MAINIVNVIFEILYKQLIVNNDFYPVISREFYRNKISVRFKKNTSA